MLKAKMSVLVIALLMSTLVALPSLGAQQITIGAILFGRDSFFQNIQQGMEKAAKDAGVKLLVSVHDHDIAKETTFIEDYVARGVTAMIRRFGTFRNMSIFCVRFSQHPYAARPHSFMIGN